MLEDEFMDFKTLQQNILLFDTYTSATGDIKARPRASKTQGKQDPGQARPRASKTQGKQDPGQARPRASKTQGK